MSRRRSSSCTEELANPLSTSYQRASQDSSFTHAGRHVSNGLTQIPDASGSLGSAEAHSDHHAVSIASSPPRTRTESAAEKPHGRRRTSVARLSEAVGHYAALLVAESPLEDHRRFLARQQADVGEEPAAAPSSWDSEAQRQRTSVAGARASVVLGKRASTFSMLGGAPPHADARARWKGAVKTLISTAELVRDSETLADQDAAPAERFVAAVGMEKLTVQTGRHSLVVLALEKRRESRFDGWLDRLVTELFITGDAIFQFFTPSRLGEHRLWFTSAFTLAVFTAFFFCIGEFPGFCLLNSPPLPDPGPCLRDANPRLLAFGPAQMTHWIAPGNAVWCFGNTPWMLSGDFLIAWGAKWGPLMRRQPWRFVTSWFIHESFMHVLSNMLLFLVVACQIEEKYGWWRISLLWVVSALGGNFFSAAFENSCLAVAGASGGIFGMIGLYIADMILNFESIKRPIMRAVMMLAFLCFFIATVASTPTGTSHISHVGGFLCGIFPSFLFLPNLRSERWEAWLPFTGGALTAAVFITLPTYFYLGRLPHLGDCGEDMSRFD